MSCHVFRQLVELDNCWTDAWIWTILSYLEFEWRSLESQRHKKYQDMFVTVLACHYFRFTWLMIPCITRNTSNWACRPWVWDKNNKDVSSRPIVQETWDKMCTHDRRIEYYKSGCSRPHVIDTGSVSGFVLTLLWEYTKDVMCKDINQ